MTPEQLKRLFEENVRRRRRLVRAHMMTGVALGDLGKSSGGGSAPVVFTPRTFFGDGSGATDSGVWYDTSDLSTMYQDSAGTTPALVGQPVGLLLDKRLGGAGAEKIANGTFDTNISGVSATQNCTIAWVNGELELTATAVGVCIADISLAGLTIGTAYVGTGQARVGQVGGTAYYGVFGGGGVYALVTTSQTMTPVRFQWVADNAACLFRIRFDSTAIGQKSYFDNASFKALPGNHATQATTSAKPVLRQDANSNYYLEFDGVDDWLRSTFTIAQPWDRVSAVQQISWTFPDRILGGGSAVAGLLYQSDVSPEIRIHDGADVGDVSFPVGTNGIVTERHGATARLALNNAAYVTGNSGATAPGGITLGAEHNGTAASNIRFYGTVMIGRSLTDAETTQVRTLLASKSGVTL